MTACVYFDVDPDGCNPACFDDTGSDEALASTLVLNQARATVAVRGNSTTGHDEASTGNEHTANMPPNIPTKDDGVAQDELTPAPTRPSSSPTRRTPQLRGTPKRGETRPPTVPLPSRLHDLARVRDEKLAAKREAALLARRDEEDKHIASARAAHATTARYQYQASGCHRAACHYGESLSEVKRSPTRVKTASRTSTANRCDDATARPEHAAAQLRPRLDDPEAHDAHSAGSGEQDLEGFDDLEN